MRWQLQHVTPGGGRFPVAEHDFGNLAEPTDLAAFWRWFRRTKLRYPATATTRWDFVRADSPKYREVSHVG